MRTINRFGYVLAFAPMALIPSHGELGNAQVSRALGTSVILHAVKAYAKSNASRSGWDVILSSWDDEELRLAIGRETSVAGAIQRVAKCARALNEARLVLS